MESFIDRKLTCVVSICLYFDSGLSPLNNSEMQNTGTVSMHKWHCSPFHGSLESVLEWKILSSYSVNLLGFVLGSICKDQLYVKKSTFLVDSKIRILSRFILYQEKHGAFPGHFENMKYKEKYQKRICIMTKLFF